MKRTYFIIAACLFAIPALAQKGNIGFVYPSGAQKGTTVEVTVGGQNLSKATGIIVSGEGVKGELIPSSAGMKKKKKGKKNIGEEDNLQLADQVKFRITVAPDAASGIRDLRLSMPDGVTNRLYFEVGELNDVNEFPADPLSGTAQSLPVTFNGQIMRSDVDRFSFPAKKGQQLVIRVKARIFVPYMADAVPGWFQPIARLYGPDGKEVAFNDDYTFHIDPVIIYKVPQSGDYEVEINDALYRGREDFVYRIDVGELPFITSISPLGGPVGKKTELALTGYNLGRNVTVINPRKEGFQEVVVLSSDGISSNTMLYEATVESQKKTRKLQANLSRETAWELSCNECVENCISAPLQQHWYKFNVSGNKNTMHISVISRQLGTPADIRMTLYDEDGNVIKDVDDFEDEGDCMTTHFADPQMTLPLESGQYFLRVIESQGHYGAEFAYRLHISDASPDFSLHLEPATFTVPEKGTGIFNVFITRKQNFAGNVDLKISGLPKNFKVSGNSLKPRQKKTIVSITAPEGCEKGNYIPEVSGTATGGNVNITRKGIPVESMMQAFYYTHLMPVDEFRMEVTEEQPFRLSVEKTWGSSLLLTSEGTEIKVNVERNPGFTSPVTLMLKSSVSSVKAEAVIVGENENSGTLVIRNNMKNNGKKAKYVSLTVSGVVKASSKRIAGKARNAFVAAVTAYTPVFEAHTPGK